jgi:hypothetical protein
MSGVLIGFGFSRALAFDIEKFDPKTQRLVFHAIETECGKVLKMEQAGSILLTAMMLNDKDGISKLDKEEKQDKANQIVTTCNTFPKQTFFNLSSYLLD